MSRIVTYSTDKKINFLESQVGLVTKTYTVSADGVTADEWGNKIVPAGTVLPKNDATAKGILFEDVDVTEGDHEGALIVAGRIYSDCLADTTLNTNAKTALEGIGIKFFTSSGVNRA